MLTKIFEELDRNGPFIILAALVSMFAMTFLLGNVADPVLRKWLVLVHTIILIPATIIVIRTVLKQLK